MPLIDGIGIKGREDYKAAIKEAKQNPDSPKAKELQEAGVYGSQFGEDEGFNIFTASEPANKGYTYFSAKAQALKSGMTEAEARLYGKKAVEQIQFQSSFVNRPKAFRQASRVNLALLSFIYKERRWYLSHLKNATQSFAADPKVRASARNSARTLAYYLIGNGLVNGVNADIPEEFGQIWKALNPAGYQAWRKATNQFSLMGALNLNMDEFARIPLTNVGIATKAPVAFDAIGKIADTVWMAMNHPEDPKKWLRAAQSSILAMPVGKLPVVGAAGGKNINAALEYFYRSITGDYERRTPKGHIYNTGNWEELQNALRGGRESRIRDEQKQQLDLPRSSGF